MSGVLSRLPVAYAVLHDLNVPGAKGTIDHLVIGPGGAFIVVSRRYGEHIDYRDGQLWAGHRSMRSVLDGARIESEAMTQALATPVVPVLVLLNTLMPAATPGVVDGVLVTSDDYVVRVVTRGAHTLLSPDKVVELSQRALPMLHTATSVERTADSTGVRVDSGEERVMRLPVPAPFRGLPVKGDEPAAPVAAAPLVATLAAAAAAPAQPQWQRSKWTIAAIILGICLIVAALGFVAYSMAKDDSGASTPTVAPSTSGAPSTTFKSTTTVASTVAPTTTAAPTNPLLAPVVEYTAVCPAPGAGWEMIPTWPGDITDLAEYDVEMLITNSWVSIAKWKDEAEETPATLRGQPADAKYTIRMTIVLDDGTRSANTPTEISTPSATC